MKLEQYKNEERNLTLNGRTMTLNDWARVLNINVDTIRKRLVKKLPIEDVLHKGRLPRKES